MTLRSKYTVHITPDQYEKLLRLWDREQIFCRASEVADTELWSKGAREIIGAALPEGWQRGEKIQLIVGGMGGDRKGDSRS